MITNPQSGNVLFYIFIAVVLFGALSYAMSQSGRGSLENLTNERNKLAAAEIVDYSDTVSKAVGVMRLRDTTLANLRFSHPDLSAADYDAPGTVAATNELYSPDGGGIIYRKAPIEALKTTTGADYAFLNSVAITEIGTTCATASCADLVMSVGNLSEAVCRAINRMADIGGSTAAPPSYAGFPYTSRFKGIMDTPSVFAGDLKGKLYGCLLNTNDSNYYFYRVLWAQ